MTGKVVRTYNKGQIILFEGDTVNSMYRLIFGAVKLYVIDDFGNESILTIRTAPDMFPLSLLIGRSAVEFYYEAITDCKIELVAPEEVGLTSDVARQAIELYLEALHRVASLEFKTAAERVVAAKQYLEERGLKATHQLIASTANTTRETASVTLRKKKKGGKE